MVICVGHGKGEGDAEAVDAGETCECEWRCSGCRLSIDSEVERDGLIPGDDAEEAATVAKLVNGSNDGVETSEDGGGTREAGEEISEHEAGLRNKWPGGLIFEPKL